MLGIILLLVLFITDRHPSFYLSIGRIRSKRSPKPAVTHVDRLQVSQNVRKNAGCVGASAFAVPSLLKKGAKNHFLVFRLTRNGAQAPFNKVPCVPSAFDPAVRLAFFVRINCTGHIFPFQGENTAPPFIQFRIINISRVSVNLNCYVSKNLFCKKEQSPFCFRPQI